MVIFEFCLYQCDREGLFKIAQEAERVLRKKSWLVIKDFFSLTPASRDYHHKEGIYSFKMDYHKLFDWSSVYNCYSYQLDDHDLRSPIDKEQNWFSTSVLRKNIKV